MEISLDEYVFGDCPIFETDVEQLKYLTYTMLALVARNVPAILITRENGKIRVEEVVEG